MQRLRRWWLRQICAVLGCKVVFRWDAASGLGGLTCERHMDGKLI